MRGGVRAGLVAGVVSGVPSTVLALVRGDDPAAAVLAAGRVLLPSERRAPPLVAAAVRALPVLPQVLDHVAFGAAAALYLRRRALRLR